MSSSEPARVLVKADFGQHLTRSMLLGGTKLGRVGFLSERSAVSSIDMKRVFNEPQRQLISVELLNEKWKSLPQCTQNKQKSVPSSLAHMESDHSRDELPELWTGCGTFREIRGDSGIICILDLGESLNPGNGRIIYVASQWVRK